MSTTPPTGTALTDAPLDGKWRYVHLLAWGLWGLMLLLVGVGLVFLFLSYDVEIGERWGPRGSIASFALPFSTVGALIMSRRPRNPIGWLFSLAGVSCGLQVLVEEWAVFAYQDFPARILPGGEFALWIAAWIWIPGAMLTWVFLPLIYPNGKLLSPHWRTVIVVNLVGALAMWFSFAFSSYWGRAYTQFPAPYPIQGLDTLFDILVYVGIGCISFATLAAMISLFIRYRRSHGDERQQIKWLLYAMLFLALTVPFSSFPAMAPLLILATLGVPIATGIAILRYRLYDIDLLINRSLVYGALTAALLAIFGVTLLIISQLAVGFDGGPLVAVAISAAVFGALFQPSRRWLQRFVDQKFYGIQIDYQKTPSHLLGREGLTQIIRQTKFAQYKGLTLIGRGGMAEVYRAEHPTLNRPVAIKILPAQLAATDEFRARFMREGQMAKELQHPNIVRVFDYGEEGGIHYMVMELIEGPDLGHHLKQRRQLTLDEARPILRDIAAALDYAHTQGLVHRDVKPSNIMLDSPDHGTGETVPRRAVLTDFGIAKILGTQTRLTQTAGALGTFDYIAPEQIHGAADVNGRADIYSFGILAYQVLTGEMPFKQQNPGALILAHLTHPAPDAREAAPDTPKTTAHAIQKAMAKKPEERFATAGEFVAALGL